MSYTEIHIGKLKKIDFNGLEPEEFFKEKCNEAGINSLHSWSDSWYEEWNYSIDDEGLLLKVGDVYYQVEKDVELEEGDSFCHVTKNTDGGYTYVTSFYNGGTCFAEMLEEGIKDTD